MRRKSAASVCIAISAMAPAISTPVAAAADDHESEQASLFSHIGRHFGPLERDQDATADARGVFDALEGRGARNSTSRHARNRNASRRSRPPDSRIGTSPELIRSFLFCVSKP